MRRLSTPPSPRRLRRRGLLGRLRRLAWWAGLPLVVGALVLGGLRLAHTPLGARLLAHTGDSILEASAALGFAVGDIEVEGRRTTHPSEILEALRARAGTPLFAVDLAQARARLEALPWVRSALIERRLPDTIHVRLVERQPLALWQHGGRIELIDRDAEVIPVARLDRFANLPLVVGEGAARHAAALVAMLASEKALAGRVSAAVWVGGRRWNLRIDNRIDVLLPENNAAAAWAELARLEGKDAILKRNVEAVDLRLPDRLVLRLTAPLKPAPSVKKKVANRT
ncbi:MAG TPA: FtsQ-type POTRA domain-containing protein [Stellaceae bacterium]|nr:FtsQ-type POTRA domain-containing protein [Stellaceae bacterium]